MSPSERIAPASAKFGTGQLMACLTLVAPTGMSGEERATWVATARQPLSGIPADLLEAGCRAAMQTCRFPSEIVPAILAEVKDRWERRKRDAANDAAAYANRHAPRLEQHAPDYVSPEQAAEILASLGLKSLSGREA